MDSRWFGAVLWNCNWEPGLTGAGQIPEEDVPSIADDIPLDNDEDTNDADAWEDIKELEKNVGNQFIHEPVKVPRWQNPFNNEGGAEALEALDWLGVHAMNKPDEFPLG